MNARAEWLQHRLSERDWEILGTLYRVSLATSGQIQRIHFSGPSQADYLRRRALKRLVRSGALNASPQRVGGPLGGSQQRIYSLNPAAQILMKMRQGVLESDPVDSGKARATRLVKHTLTVAELYVRCVELTRSDGFEIIDFRGEPQCWWPIDGRRYIKPDAHLRLANLETEVIDNWWIEVDLNTERIPAIREKFNRYLSFMSSGKPGPEGAIPRVLVTTPDNARATSLRRTLNRLGDGARNRIHIVPFDAATSFLADYANTPLESGNTPQEGTRA